MELEGLRDLASRVLDEVERAIVGKRDALELIFLALLCDGHVLLEDYPGLAKTLIARLRRRRRSSSPASSSRPT
jgi:MoxR-like ATPase